MGKLQLGEKHAISQVSELEAHSTAPCIKSALSEAFPTVTTPAVINLGWIVQVNRIPVLGDTLGPSRISSTFT